MNGWIRGRPQAWPGGKGSWFKKTANVADEWEETNQEQEWDEEAPTDPACWEQEEDDVEQEAYPAEGEEDQDDILMQQLALRAQVENGADWMARMRKVMNPGEDDSGDSSDGDFDEHRG